MHFVLYSIQSLGPLVKMSYIGTGGLLFGTIISKQGRMVKCNRNIYEASIFLITKTPRTPFLRDFRTLRM